MSYWTKIPFAFHQVSITGLVTDKQTGRGLNDALVKIVDAPPDFVTKMTTLVLLFVVADDALSADYNLLNGDGTKIEKLATVARILEDPRARRMLKAKRPDLTYSAADGSFNFVDLPAGPYSLQASLPQLGKRYKMVTKTDIDAPVRGDKFAEAKLELSPSTIKDQINIRTYAK